MPEIRLPEFAPLPSASRVVRGRALHVGAVALFWAVMIGVTVWAGMLRWPGLTLRPFHGDEANQAVRFRDLWEKGQYTYDPAEHHGPTLYYATLPAMWLRGEQSFAQTSEATFRVVAVVFGVGLVLLIGGLGDGIGRVGAVAAGLLTAVSPAMVFYSRYYIQEPLLVLFTLATIVCGWRFVQCLGRWGVVWAVVAGLSVGLMHATKETWVIAAMGMAGAGVVVWVFSRIWATGGRRFSSVLPVEEGGRVGAGRSTPSPRPCPPGGRGSLRRAVVGGVLAAGVVAVLFYSSFFSNWRGPVDSVRAYAGYLNKAQGDGIHEHPWDWYLGMLWEWKSQKPYTAHDGPYTERVILIFAVVGAVGAHWPGRRGTGLARFLVWYTLITTAVYAAIPYKTPWCMMTFLHGMILLAGFGFGSLVTAMPAWWSKGLALVVLGAAVATLHEPMWRINHVAPVYAEQRRNPHVYGHTSLDAMRFVKRMEELAAVSEKGRRLYVAMLSGDVWPMPYYLRGFENVGYFGGRAEGDPRVPPAVWPDVVVIPAVRGEALPEQLADRYVVETYGLRYGVNFYACVEKGLWARFMETRQKAWRP